MYSPGSKTGRYHNRGFTLLEVLIAFLILSISASIILDQLFVLTKFAERARAKQRHVTDYVNDANMFFISDLKRASSHIAENQLLISVPVDEKPKEVKIENFSQNQVNVPVSLAFSPFQIFDFGGEGDLAMRILLPGLLPSDGFGNGVRSK
jgi:prepilin-type N-terminal cleavage/methylation domain-containing protein